MPAPTPSKSNIVERPPVIVIMGHIDHGKSTLLDYIRKANTTLKEAGGITQRIAAYEAIHKAADGREKRITFIDTPGHEAFKTMRSAGAEVADIAVLVVSGEEGVKPQTIDAYNAIKAAKTPMIVAVNKMDRPGADLVKTKNSLLEHEIYVEGYGGEVPCVPISAKTGEGVSDLLDMMVLLADVLELTGNKDAQGKGIVIESHLDKTKGITATVIVKDGTFHAGEFVVTEDALSPLRIMQDFKGASIKSATLGSPLAIIGWDTLPKPGAEVHAFEDKKDAVAWQEEAQSLTKEIQAVEKLKTKITTAATANGDVKSIVVPLIVKAASAGIVDAIIHELKKIETDKVKFKIISQGVGTITENDVKIAIGSERDAHTLKGNIANKPIVIGFDVKIDKQAEALRDRENIEVQTFDIIYKISEWLVEIVKARTPKVMTEEETGRARILKIFTKSKKGYVLGGKLDQGLFMVGSEIKLLRREGEIGKGSIRELQQQKEKTREVAEGFEFGAAVELSIEPAAGDTLVAFTMVEK